MRPLSLIYEVSQMRRSDKPEINQIPKNIKFEYKGKIWDKFMVQGLMRVDPQALYRALIQIYEQQTATEQDIHITKIMNGLGFNSFDADCLTKLAKKVQKGYKLTDSEFFQVQKRMMKYANQILYLSKERLKIS